MLGFLSVYTLDTPVVKVVSLLATIFLISVMAASVVSL